MPDESAAKVWSDPDTFATCLLALGLDRYGTGSGSESPVHWSPQTWIDHVREDAGCLLPVRNLDRLMSACLLLQSPHEFYSSASGFNDIASGLASVWFEPTVWHPPTTEEVLWALIEAHLIRPPDADDTFSPEVVRYVNMIARNEGFRSLPPAFELFGATTDPTVWARGPDYDYSGDPDLALAVEDAASARERDLDLDTADKLRDLARRIDALPVKGPKTDTARELASYADQIAAAEPPPSDD